MAKTICLDPGHGGKDAGAVNGSRYEKNDNLRIAFALETVLKRQGFNVLLTRKDDSYVSLEERARIANKNSADLFLSLHRNSFSKPDANGIEIWVYQFTDQDTINMATFIYDEVVSVAAQSKRGVKKGNFAVTRETNMRAALLELCFISNSQDNQLYDTYFERYVDAIARSICKYFGTDFKTGDTDTSQDPDKLYELYTVQVGAFAVKENAQRLADELKLKGYSCFIAKK